VGLYRKPVETSLYSQTNYGCHFRAMSNLTNYRKRQNCIHPNSCAEYSAHVSSPDICSGGTDSKCTVEQIVGTVR
jgi:hypothetical protein